MNNWINTNIKKSNNLIYKLDKHFHLTPQHKYIPPFYIKTHFIRFENLSEEFEILMNQYNLDLKLSKHLNKSKNKIYSICDLSKENIQLINKVYRKDFIIFNYKMLQSLMKEDVVRKKIGIK